MSLIKLGVLLCAVVVFVGCPPNALLSNVETQVTLAKAGSQPVATPQISPAPATYPGPQNVTISDATAGATIQYTIDGSRPTSSSPVYSGPILVTGDGTHETIIAYANKAGMTDSALATASYVLNYNQVQTPVLSLPAGKYPPTQTVTISCSTLGASINYTTDGSTPTSSHGTAYTAPIAINANETLQAVAYKATMNDSNIASAAYTVWVYTNYLYVANGGGSGTVAGFKINVDGSLNSVGTPAVSGGSSANSVVVNKNLGGTLSSFLYTSGGNNVQAWSIGAGGVPTLLGSPLTSAYVGGPSLGITPNGSFIYAAYEISGIGSFYAIGSDGKLTYKSDFTTAGGTDPIGVAVTSDGLFFYVADWGNSLITAYSIAVDGTPTAFNTFVTSQHPLLPSASPAGPFLFLGNQYVGSGYFSSYAIDAGGSLTSKGAPATGGVYVFGSAVSPDGKYVFVANNVSNTISGFSIATDGTLTALSTPTFATGSGPEFLAFSPDGKYLYVTNDNDGTISGFSVGGNGLLTSLGAATPSGGTQPAGIVTAKIGQ